jgi:hypothetical protein
VSAGYDGLKAEFILWGQEALVKPITILMNRLWEGLPKSLREANVLPIPKIAAPQEPDDYRPITMVSALVKVYAYILIDRILVDLHFSKGISDSQFGFRHCRETSNAIFILTELLDNAEKEKKPIYCTFLDIAAAYDSCSHPGILWTLKEYAKVRDDTWRALERLLSGEEIRHIIGEKGAIAKVRSGVKQGDPLSPLLFDIAYQHLLSEIDKLKIGVKYKGILIAALAFADDLCILTESLEDMQTILSALERVSGKIGLKFNPKKTEVLRTGSLVNKSNSGLRLCGEEIKLSVDFKYLGATVDKEGKRSMSKERIKMMGNFNHTRAALE